MSDSATPVVHRRPRPDRETGVMDVACTELL